VVAEAGAAMTRHYLLRFAAVLFLVAVVVLLWI
jgi:hypothetical protein